MSNSFSEGLELDTGAEEGSEEELSVLDEDSSELEEELLELDEDSSELDDDSSELDELVSSLELGVDSGGMSTVSVRVVPQRVQV